MQLKHTPIRRDGAGWIPIGLCCLLLLLPMLIAPAPMQRAYETESEESRQPAEEERSSEAALNPRPTGGRRFVRTAETRQATANYRTRGNSNCSSGALALLAPSEHQFRNGIGGPLRC